MVECDLVPEVTPLDHMRQLRERLEAESLAHRRRISLTRKLDRARAAHRRAKKQLRVADRHVGDFFTRWSVTTEKDFIAKVDRRPLFEQAQRDAEVAESAWLTARRRVTGPAELDQWLTDDHVGDTSTLQQRLADACAATERLRSSLALARDRRGGIAAKVDATAKDRSTEPLQAELADVEQQLAAQLDRRRLLERTGLLLEETRLSVARDHQPPVLRDASHWLTRLTDGRHTSITTTIDEARLEVHDADGGVWKPERLSRGTREQVFLALRLALVRDLQRHGVQLPLVMDDALVNFDDDRARAAARVRVEFVSDQPGERQMLVFTCHAHVAEIFAEAQASVRSLSDPGREWRRPLASPELVAKRASVPVKRVSVAVPPPIAVAAVPPIVVAVPPPQPVAEPVHFDWPAQEFFFSPTGGYAVMHGHRAIPAPRPTQPPRSTAGKKNGSRRRRSL